MRENILWDSLEVRPILSNEVSLWGEHIKRYHYLGYRSIPGKSLRYIATVGSEWVALIGWGSPALKCTARDRFIGWDDERKLKRLHLVTNNVRFLILPWIRISNLASKVLSLNLKRLSSDFQKVYGHPVYLAETFVDIALYKGTCYKAANWRYVGLSRGYSKSGDRYYKTNRPKAVYVYPLVRKARELLGAAFIPYDFTLIEKGGMMVEALNLPVEGLIEEIKRITDPRKARGIRHPLHTILGIAVCAVMFGARSYRAIADWAAGLTQEQLRRFGSRRAEAPSEPTIRRVIQRIDVEEFDRKIGMWLQRSQSPSGKAIAMDGKTLRGSGDGEESALHLLSAVLHKEGIVIAQKDVEERTNEITRVKPLLEGLNIERSVVTGDALLTQREIARYIVEKKKADYLFTVKGNQQELLEDIRALELKKKTPAHSTVEKAHGRIERRTIWVSSELKGYVSFPYAEQFFVVERKVYYMNGENSEETAYGITSLRKEEASAERLLELNRGHWEIENRVHYVRDVTFDEDRSQIRKGNGAHIMASLRNLVISIFRLLGFKYVPEAIRYFTMRLEAVFQVLGI